MAGIRIIVGGIGMLVAVACVLFIVGNAAAEAISNESWIVAFVAIGAFPLTFFIYPFIAPDAALAWPLDDGTNFIPFLVAALIGHALGTFVGGYEPLDAR